MLKNIVKINFGLLVGSVIGYLFRDVDPGEYVIVIAVLSVVLVVNIVLLFIQKRSFQSDTDHPS